MTGTTFFRVRVAAITALTPTFRRFTFHGDDLARCAGPGWDQRIKVIFPNATATLDAMPSGDDWFSVWRAMPAEARPAMRTYTMRAVRAEQHEVDIDMVAHEAAGEATGPASAWIQSARVGDEVLILAPSTPYDPAGGGIDFVPPAHTGAYLLAGDETAAPAIAAILEQLPADARGIVVVEVPEPGDVDYLPHHPGFDYRIGARGGTRHAHLVPATAAAARALVPAGRGADVEEIDIDHTLLWEVPRTARGGAALRSAPLYAWLAGEAGGIRQLRRHLVTEQGVDRRAVAFMGYWRLGRPES